MKPANGKILVRLNMAQKDTLVIGPMVLKIANKYQTNYREKSPVVAEIVEGNKEIRPGQVAIFHHNHFYPPSPYFLHSDLYSVPFNKTLFAIVYQDGNLRPMCGNILCNRVDIETVIELPPEQRKKHIDRVIVTNPGNTPYKEGQLLFMRPNSYYEIVYNLNGVECRVHKIHADSVVGMGE
jgi:hypothetical protein